MSKKENIKNLFTNPKTRAPVFIVLGTIGLAIGYGIFSGSGEKKTNEELQAKASVANGVNNTAIPGTSNSEKYNELQVKANDLNGQKALENGESFTPTLSNNQKVDDPFASKTEPTTNNDINVNENNVGVMPVQPQLPQPSQPEPQIMSQVAASTDVKTYKYTSEIQKMVADYSKNWNPRPQNLEKAALEKDAKSGNATSTASASASKTNSAVTVVNTVDTIKATTIMNAILLTGINSDEPSPVLAQVVSGSYKGSKLLGKLTVAKEKVLVVFDTLVLPENNVFGVGPDKSTLKVTSYAVDPSTQRVSLGKDVDNHYFEKYVGLVAATFLSGYAELKSTLATSTTTSSTGAISQSTESASEKQAIYGGVKEVADVLVDDIKKKTTVAPTITVPSGIPVGILFTTDVKVNK